MPHVSGPLDDEFTRFIQMRLGSLRRVAYLLCQDWQRADDLVQITITRLYVRWDRARQMEHPDAYARTILVREYLGEQRSGWARRVMLDRAVPDAAGPEHDCETALDLRAALAGLPPRQRATLVLRFYCDLSVEQTGQLLGCSGGTVKSQTAKALGALRARLGPDPGRAGGPDPGRAGGPDPGPDRPSPSPAGREPASLQTRREVTQHG
jgi:RNA polymerase sigma-70 factor (sigma-E family)